MSKNNNLKIIPERIKYKKDDLKNIKVGFVHHGFELHGVNIFGKELSLEASKTIDHVINFEKVCIDEEFINTVDIINKTDIVHLQYVLNSEAFWGGEEKHLQTLEKFLSQVKIPIIVTLHDLFLINLKKNNLNAIRILAKYAQAVTVFSLQEHDFIKNENFKNTYLVQHHLKSNVKPIKESDLRKKLKLQKNKILTILGHVYGRKKYDFVIRCLKKLPEEYVLIIAGGASNIRNKKYYEDLQDLVKINKLEKRVIFTGSLSSEDYFDYLQISDLGIVPHEKMAGSGTISDWISSGKGFIALKNTFTTELSANYPESFLTSDFIEKEFIEKIKNFFNGHSYLNQDSKKRIQEDFSIENIINKYFFIYKTFASIIYRDIKLPKKLYAITSYYNPAKYINKYENFKIFKENLTKQGVKLLTVEVSFDKSFEIKKNDSDILIQIQGEDENLMWQKERLLTIALKNLPKDCDYVAWLDCDIVFSNNLWAQDTIKELQFYDIIQPFTNSVRLPKDDYDFSKDVENLDSGRENNQKEFSVGYKKYQEGMVRHAGFAWAAKRVFIDKYGFYDKSIIGFGDYIMSETFLNKNLYGVLKHFPKKMRKDILKWSIPVKEYVKGNVSCIEGTVFHLWHGDRVNRLHGIREKWLRKYKFNPSKDIVIGVNDLWKWNTNKNILHYNLKNLFKNRKEDVVVNFSIPDFDFDFYKQRYPDIRYIKNNSELYDHYIIHGRIEGRLYNKELFYKTSLFNKIKDILLVYNYKFKYFNKKHKREVFLIIKNLVTKF